MIEEGDWVTFRYDKFFHAGRVVTLSDTSIVIKSYDRIWGFPTKVFIEEMMINEDEGQTPQPRMP